VHPVPSIAPKVFHLEIVVKLVQLRGVNAGPKTARLGSNDKSFLIGWGPLAQAQTLADGVVHDILEVAVGTSRKLLEPPREIVLESQRSSHTDIMMSDMTSVKMLIHKIL
jgi:hypothetical protein